MILNEAMSLIVVVTALPPASPPFPTPARAPLVRRRQLLAGSLFGAWIGASWATPMRSATLSRVLAALLVLIALTLPLSHVGTLEPLALAAPVRVGAGLLARVGIGIVAALMGVAGSELLIPTIVLLFAVHI